MRIKFIFLTILTFILFISIFFIVHRNENKDKKIVEFNNQQYSAIRNFQVNQSYFDSNSRLKSEYSTNIANINGSKVYSISGLDVKDWIYYDYANCDVSFYLSKNIYTNLDYRYFNFLNKFQLTKYNYTIEDGLQKVIDRTIENEEIVSYAYKTASSDGNSDMGVTSDKVTTYSLLLTPKDFPALQYIINYYECENGYFIGSNTNGLCTKVDNSIHEMIIRLK
ncbi:hypothetical protein CBE01nite_25990 [Clostridium beijerinckii]|uniref:Uncharacterized protein n=1 Tax=Clostridium beijerinckii TaxID=1520 RepID=A0AB74VCA4_CLOBE|nr:hypothetical protein [Clostridium beijerinckii]NRZ28366.1 hypothetical protein [Clostridium beijerinckii]NYB95859.1 hypothetical protein [Clostridium beijerinckii]OOM25186.1 hypothetical protein CLBEI_16860 [Clostridium beijerinckii]QUN34083.1 hypothetical protein KEC93_19375 [Clostridium beijerinckii]SQB00999.1 Uncharacterised protein [Clostridium beijerinckii]